MMNPSSRALVEREAEEPLSWWRAVAGVVAGAAAADAGRLCAGVRTVHALAGAGQVRRQFVAYFLAVGLWPWLAFAEASRSATALIAQSALIWNGTAARLGAAVGRVGDVSLNWLALTVIVLLFKLLGFSVHLSGILFSLPTGLARARFTAMGLAWIVSDRTDSGARR